ncbi:MAG: LysM peptidoglycan-binding domain-containing protein [Oscillospiraceae bacterium]|nr:LysM peptidoglycan-binding domain-containing protein [Oscillospiraceae bacterium]
MSDNEMKHVSDEKLAQASGGVSQPGRQKIGYTVRRGDTLIKIANYWGVSVLDLVAWNDIKNPDLIYAGQTLVIYKG